MFGFTALYLSDIAFVRYVSEPLLSQVQAIKASVEVLLTGVLVFVLVRTSRYPLERSNGKLERKQEELQVLHRVLRHNLRNDLNVVMGLAEFLRDGLPEDGRADCDQILQSSSDILHYTHQANLIRRVTEQNGNLTTYELGERIPELVEMYEQAGDVDVSLQLPDEAAVEVNHMFEAALGELITNAIEHNGSGTPKVSVSVSKGGGQRGTTEVSVADDGSGIPGYVARRLGRSEADQVHHLDGMGLWFVYWTVMESGGEFLIEESEMGGSRVRMWVPQAISTFDGTTVLPPA